MKNYKYAKTNKTKSLMLVILITSTVIAASVATLYFSTQVDKTSISGQCDDVNDSTSANGLIVVSEADLGCFGEHQKLSDFKQNKEMVILVTSIVGVMSFLINIVAIGYVYKRV